MGDDSMNVGFIGTGSMGSILIEAFLRSGAISSENMILYNRTLEKAEKVVSRNTGVTIAESVEDLINISDVVFICVRPNDYKPILQQLQQFGRTEQTIVSITSAVLLEDLVAILPNKIIKMIPSITNASLSGATLIMYDPRFSIAEKNVWNRFFAAISQPIEIDETFVRVSSDLSSCGPAFFSYLFQNFIESAVKQTGISKESASLLVTEMIIGFGKLLSIGGFTLETLEQRVCVPGGVTGVGLAVLREEIGPLFEHLFQKTHQKYDEDVGECKEWLDSLHSFKL